MDDSVDENKVMKKQGIWKVFLIIDKNVDLVKIIFYGIYRMLDFCIQRTRIYKLKFLRE